MCVCCTSISFLGAQLNWLHFILTLQVRPSDLDRYQLPPQCRLEMTEHDKKMGEELLKEPFIQKHPEWIKELEIMMKSGEKAEIQVQHTALSLCFASSCSCPISCCMCEVFLFITVSFSLSFAGAEFVWFSVYYGTVSAQKVAGR